MNTQKTTKAKRTASATQTDLKQAEELKKIFTKIEELAQLYLYLESAIHREIERESLEVERDPIMGETAAEIEKSIVKQYAEIESKKQDLKGTFHAVTKEIIAQSRLLEPENKPLLDFLMKAKKDSAILYILSEIIKGTQYELTTPKEFAQYESEARELLESQKVQK